jgi:hypothetical protein
VDLEYLSLPIHLSLDRKLFFVDYEGESLYLSLIIFGGKYKLTSQSLILIFKFYRFAPNLIGNIQIMTNLSTAII